MSRVLFVSLFAFLFGSASPVFSAESQPNVLIVLVDDQGYYDLGCYGATEVKTPRIDALAKAGIRFTDYYAAAPICTPSRAGLLTGCYPRRIGLETWVQRADSKIGIHPDERTLGELFGEAGYTTTCIGKWHLGFADSFLPLSQGSPGARARRARRRRPTRAQRRARAPGACGARRRGRCTHVIHPRGYMRGDTGQRRGSGR